MFRVTSKTRVDTLLKRYPDTEDLFSWYGLDPDSHDRRMTLGELCRAWSMDLDELLVDVETTIFESEQDEDEDEWDDDDDDDVDDDWEDEDEDEDEDEPPEDEGYIVDFDDDEDDEDDD